MDARAILISQAYQLVRCRLASVASPVLQMTLERDALHAEVQWLKRELEIFQQQLCQYRLPPAWGISARNQNHADTPRCLNATDNPYSLAKEHSFLRDGYARPAIVCTIINSQRFLLANRSRPYQSNNLLRRYTLSPEGKELARFDAGEHIRSQTILPPHPGSSPGSAPGIFLRTSGGGARIVLLTNSGKLILLDCQLKPIASHQFKLTQGTGFCSVENKLI